MTASLRPDGEDGLVSQQETQIRVEEVLVCPVWCFLTGETPQDAEGFLQCSAGGGLVFRRRS